MIEFVCVTIFIASYSCFSILFIGTTGIREQVIIKAPIMISKLFSCDFCLSWWTCLFISIVWAILSGDCRYVLCSIAATPITRIML